MRLPFARPYTNYVTSHYGYRTYTNQNGVTVNDWHNGVDLRGRSYRIPVDETNKPDELIPVQAVESGTVRSTGHGSSGEGNYVTVQVSDKNIRHYYYHLYSISVVAGSQVNEGDEIGIMGNSGSSTGTHLHFEVRQGDYKWAADESNSASVNAAEYLGIVNTVGSSRLDDGPISPGPIGDGTNPPTEVSDDLFHEKEAERDRLSGQLAALQAAVPAARDARDAAIALYDERRRDQTNAEMELAGKETNAENLRKENGQKLAGLHTHIAGLFEKTKAAVLQSIAALCQRIQDKLEAIRKRLQEAMNPITGARGSLWQLVEDLFSQHRGDALQAQEYDGKQLDAPVYDARDLSAFTYDTKGKLHI